MNDVTVDLILSTLRDWVVEKQVISPDVYLDAAQKLVVLVGDENDKLFTLQQKVAQSKTTFIMEGDSVAKAKAKVEASDEYREMLRQKGKIEQIWELVRVAKLRARTATSEMGLN